MAPQVKRVIRVAIIGGGISKSTKATIAAKAAPEFGGLGLWAWDLTPVTACVLRRDCPGCAATRAAREECQDHRKSLDRHLQALRALLTLLAVGSRSTSATARPAESGATQPGLGLEWTCRSTSTHSTATSTQTGARCLPAATRSLPVSLLAHRCLSGLANSRVGWSPSANSPPQTGS